MLANVMDGNGFFIVASRTFGDRETGNFFARIVFEDDGGRGDLAALSAALKTTGETLNAYWRVHPGDARIKTLVLVSKSDHCANTLLHAARRGELPIAPVGIVSNHAEMAEAFSHFDVAFTHIPVTTQTKDQAEAALLELIAETGAELVVLARYMQVLSNSAARALEGRCINIHHSFLPSFKGARPYHQAHARGVKVIGATAHYVTGDLDEGPIITQVTEPVDHSFSPADLIQLGRHLEGTALLRAVSAHAERRVLMNDHKTVVFGR